MLSITPLYVQRDDHALGLIHLLTIASRFLTLGDHLAQQALAQDRQELAGIYAGNPNRSTPRPTTERMLKAIENINLLLVEGQDGAEYIQIQLSNFFELTASNKAQLCKSKRQQKKVARLS